MRRLPTSAAWSAASRYRIGRASVSIKDLFDVAGELTRRR